MTCPLYKLEASIAGEGVCFGQDERDYEGLQHREWFDLHHKRFLLPIEEITASRVQMAWHVPDHYEGVYFLFTDDALQYVGQSVRMTERLHKHAFPHWNRKQVPWITHYARFPTRLFGADSIAGTWLCSIGIPRTGRSVTAELSMALCFKRNWSWPRNPP